MGYRASIEEFDITPLAIDEGREVLIQGTAAQIRDGQVCFCRIRHIGSRPKMQVLLLEDGIGEKALLVAADVFGFDRDLTDLVRDEAARWGIAPSAVLLNASHTHYNAGTVKGVAAVLGGRDEDYTSWLGRCICRAIPRLYENLQPCVIEYGTCKAHVGVSRRLPGKGRVLFAPNPAGAYDALTSVLDLKWSDGREGLIVVHGCHPTGLDDEICLSADFPGFMRDALVRQGLSTAMFLQGAGAAAKPVWHDEDGIRFAHNLAEVKTVGEKLAEAVGTVGPDESNVLAARIRSVDRVLRLPLATPPSDKLKRMVDGPPDLLDREWANAMLAMGSNIPSILELELNVLALGDLLLFALPAEPVAELATALRGLSEERSSKASVLGCTNGLRGYLVTGRMLADGGYESVRGPRCYLLPQFSPGVEDKILDSAASCLDEIAVQTTVPETGARLQTGPAFFVMSSGRCGTQTLSRILGFASNARVWHHPQPDPIDAALRAYWGRDDGLETFWRSRGGVIRNTWRVGLVHGETDVTLTPFCIAIAESLPRSRFLIMVRRPHDFVRSGMRRGYYTTNSRWDRGRLRPSPDSDDFHPWSRYSQFEKVCWLWVETYRRILAMAECIGWERVLLVRFEDLIHGVDTVRNIYEFLGLEGFEPGQIETVLSQPLNVQREGDFPQVSDWTGQMHATLWDICGEVAQELGYGFQT